MAIKKGRALTLTFDGTKIGNITSISLSVDGETIQVTDFDSGDWNSYLAGQKDWTMEVSVNHNPEDDAQQDAVEQAMFSSGRAGTVDFGPETPTTGDINYTGDAILTNLSVDASDANEVVAGSYSIQGNGALTRNVAV